MKTLYLFCLKTIDVIQITENNASSVITTPATTSIPITLINDSNFFF